MPKLNFEDESDSDLDIKINNEYAKQYDQWRKKEELNKLKTKYGEENLDDESSSSSDDEEGVEITDEVEKDFFKTLAALKNKDPKIYDKNVTFFESSANDNSTKIKSKKKDQPMYIKDYERKLLLEKGGIISDDEDLENGKDVSRDPTYNEEQKKLKENVKKALQNIDENEDDTWGGLFTQRKKTEEEESKEDADYKKWLAGQKNEVDEEIVSELKPLKEFWNDPNLDEGEKFLRDYILDKKFLNNGDNDYIPTYDEIIHDSDEGLSHDEEEIEKQEEFEHKYNFRFEEPDSEFIKRYPRVMENSLRRKDEKRKVKRAEVKERKKKEKEEKMAEIRKLQELKRNEIEEKIEKLKEITGNADLEFKEEDIDGDFDPEAHDQRMKALFDDEFYEGAEGDQKPEFPDIDEELEIEKWDNWDNNEYETSQYEPHCEDEDFNMDADYDPNKPESEELAGPSQRSKKRKRKSKVAQAIAKPKPVFDPKEKSYEEYFDEYYKLDCEDIIGDLPCRFKYREVVPNDFGLTVEEILLAKDRELNKWCSLKKAIQRRPEHVEKYDQVAYAKKAKNFELKKKLIPSLYTPDSDEEASQEKPRNSTNQTQNEVNQLQGNKKKKNKLKISSTERCDDSAEKIENKNVDVTSPEKIEKRNVDATSTEKSKKKRKKKSKQKKIDKPDNLNVQIKDQLIKNLENKNGNEGYDNTKQKSMKRKRKDPEIVKSKKLKMKEKGTDIKPKLTDARLLAYGINPKKYKNLLKYGKKMKQ